MQKQTLRPCPICSATEAELLHTQQFAIPANVPLPDEYDIVSCTTCQYVYADTPNNQKTYETYYATHAKYESSTSTQQDDARHQATTDFLSQYLDLNSNILDIGCSNGDLLHKLKIKGFKNLCGLDPSPTCIDQLTQSGIMGFPYTLSDFQNQSHLIKTQDCVVLSHVMEHLVSPNDMMISTQKIIKENGLLYIEVPDASRYRFHFFKSFHYFDVEHINHFDQDSLTNLAHLHGFEVLACNSKIIPVSETVEIPAIYVLMKNVKTNKKKDLIQCSKLKLAMQEYIRLSQQELDKSLINQLAENQDPIILWGMGSYAQTLLKSSSLKDCNIVDIVDRDPKKQGLKIHDLEIKSPKTLLEKKHTNTKIVIASIPFANEISNEIKAMGIDLPILIA